MEKVSRECLGTLAGVFWIYAFICVMSFLFGWAMLPEMKGRTLEQIAQSWGRGARSRAVDSRCAASAAPDGDVEGLVDP